MIERSSPERGYPTRFCFPIRPIPLSSIRGCSPFRLEFRLSWTNCLAFDGARTCFQQKPMFWGWPNIYIGTGPCCIKILRLNPLMASLLLIGKSNLDLKELSYDAYVAIAIAFVSSVKENPIHSLLKALKQRPGMNPSMEAASGNTGIKQFRFLVSIAAAAVRKSIIAIERNSTVFGSAFLPIPLGYCLWTGMTWKST